MRHVQTTVSLNISEGAELSCTMHGSDDATVLFGEQGADHELTFDYESLKDLVAQTVKVLAEMETKAEEEAAEEPTD